MEKFPRSFSIEEQPKVAQDPVGTLIEQLKENPEFSNSSEEFDFSFLSPTQRAESMWAIFTDLKSKKRKKFDLQNRVDETKKEEGKPELKKLDDEARKEYSILSVLYNDEETKRAYLEANERHLRENYEINGDKERCHALQEKVKLLEDSIDASARDIFSKRDKGASEADLLIFEVNKMTLERVRIELAGLLESNPKLWALSQYENNQKLAQEISETGFGWVPSKRRYFEEIERAAMSGRPVLLSGPSGTGKTTLTRETAIKLTGLTNNETPGKDTRFDTLVAKRSFIKVGDKEETYYDYGELGEAMTGKKSTLNKEPVHHGRVIFDDEFNLLPPAEQTERLSRIASWTPGKKIRMPVTGEDEVIQPKFLYVAAVNLASSRYERNKIPPEVLRKFSKVDVDYMDQTPESPEIYESMLAALTDKNGRIKGTVEELSPSYEIKEETRKVVLSEDQEVTQHIQRRVFKETEQVGTVEKPAGGFLWRFASALNEINKSFSDQETVLKSLGKAQHLKDLIIDIGTILGWLKEYRTIGRVLSLEKFIAERLNNEFLGKSTYSEEDRKLATKFFKHFGIETDPTKVAITKPKEEIMTPVQMGMLSPRVKYFEVVSEEPVIRDSYFIDEMGKRVEYDIKPIVEDGKTLTPGSVIIGKNGKRLEYVGILKESKKGFYRPYNEVVPKPPETPQNPEGATIDEAREILGSRVFGPEQVEQAFGITIENVPEIPFTREQLEQARDKGMDLILYTDKLQDGKDLTALSLVEYLGNKQSQGATPKEKYPILSSFESNDWKRKEDFFTKETPGLKWKLVSREVIPNSTNQNYLQQTQTLANYVRSLYNEDPANTKEIPRDIQQALDEFNLLLVSEPDFPQKVVSQTEAEWKYAAEKLSNLQLTQLFRESCVENIYRLALTDRTKLDTDTQLLRAMYSWTKTLTSVGGLVVSGSFDVTGAGVDRCRPGYSNSAIGLSFSAVFL